MLSINVLGSPSVAEATTRRTLNLSSRSTALLGLLVAHSGHPQTRASIAGLFWPDSGDAQALTNLRRELHQLRAVLGDDDSLEVTSTQLCWHDQKRHRVDLTTFVKETARALDSTDDAVVVAHGTAALEQYRGAFLAGIEGEWLDPIRDDLARQCVAVCRVVERAASRSGRNDVALSVVRRHLELEPYDEDAHRRLMEVQSASGDRAGAISTYHRLSGLLERELGVEPDPQTRALFSHLLGAPSATSRRPPLAARATTNLPLVGRGAELDRTLGAWHAASAGRAAVLAVSGDPGVGKTRLVDELLAHARREGAIVATGRCFDIRGQISLSPVADWLREGELTAARELLDEVWRAEIDRLLPSAPTGPERPAGEVPPTDRHDAWQRHRFFEGLARAVMAPARPVLLVLDNAQWSDPDTLSFARFLLNIVPAAPLLLALTLRPPTDSEDAPIAQWLAGLAADGLLTEVALSPLDAAGTAELATELSGIPIEMDAQKLLHDATGGFPLYVIEAVRTSPTLRLGTEGSNPDRWSAILTKRLQQTSPAAREVAGLAAAVGRDFTIPLIVEASDLAPEAVVAGVDELWRQRILTETRAGYDFAHDLLREAAYRSVGRTRQWLLHRRLAEALELMWRGHTDAVANQIAEQYRRAGDAERALSYYQQAAEAATTLFAHGQAVALLTSARQLLLSLPESRDRNAQELQLLELVIPPVTAQYGYASPRLREACERALELSEELGQAASYVDALVGLWASRFVGGRTQDCYDIAAQAVARVRPGDARYAEAHFSFAGSALHRGDPVLADREFRIAEGSMREEALTFGTRARVHALAWWAHAAWTLGDVERARTLAVAAVDEADVSGHRYSQVVGLAFDAITQQLLGESEDCRRSAEMVRQLCDRYQFTYYGEWGRILEGWSVGGEKGVSLMEEGLRHLAAMGARARLPYWLSLLAERTDDPQRAAALLTQAVTESDRSGDRWWLPELLRRQAELLDDPGAERTLRRALEVATEQQSALLAQRVRADLAARPPHPDASG